MSILDRPLAPAPGADADLSAEGVHRDPTNHDPLATGTFAQRLVNRVSGALTGRRSSRRSFLTRTAVVGSALAMGPIDFLLKPGTAYGYVCGTCSDGWTAFCCTINNGVNACPPGSFIAGWWKADNAAYCCGAARYIIDCNATCPTQCTCRCAGGSCDGRRTCCNQFRYGQCHQEIACYGPVVCRVATCTVPWKYDPTCTTASATDNRTREHGAPCLTKECGGTIAAKYAALGGATGLLGPVVQAEQAVGDGRGRYARYAKGAIYWSPSTLAWEVHGAILTEYERQGIARLGYPTADTRTAADGKTRFSSFEKGRIYYRGALGTFTVPEPINAKHLKFAVLGYPVAAVKPTEGGAGTFQDFDKGRFYARRGKAAEVHGAVLTHHDAQGGVAGPLGFPVTDLEPIDDRRGKSQWFDGGLLWYSPTTGAHSLLWGEVLDRYVANGHCKGALKYPTSDLLEVGDRRGTYATFEKGRIYATDATGGHQVHGAVLTAWLDRFGGPTGRLGYPTSELDPQGTPGGRFQSFERGRLQYLETGAVLEV